MQSWSIYIYIYIYICMYVYIIIVWTPQLQIGGMEISKYWIMGGLKKLIINGWVRHNGGLDLKIGEEGEPFQSNFGATKDT